MIASFFNYIVGYNKPNDTYNNANNKIDTLKYNSIKLPYELVNIILEYDGRIKYKYKNKNSIDYHKFVNVIHRHDERYNTITPIINKKQTILENAELSSNKSGFRIQIIFDKQPCLLLCYEYNMSIPNKFDIYYVNMKEPRAIISSDIITTNYK